MIYVFSLPSGHFLHISAPSLASALLTAQQTNPLASFAGISFQS